MSIGTIGRVMRSTRTRMIAMDGDESTALFRDKFGLGDGDYIEIKRCLSRGLCREKWVKARILEIESCYFNRNGGYTAWLKVAPLNNDGSVGCTRRVIFAVDRKGKTCDHPEARFIVE